MNRPATIPDALFATVERGCGEYVFHLAEGPVRLPCAELVERARAGARRLRALGVAPGDPVGLLGPNRPQWVVWAFATWLAGAVLVPVQKPLRVRDPAVFSEHLRLLVEAAGCRLVLADPELASLLPPGLAVPWREPRAPGGEQPDLPAPGSTAVIQFTSGSTTVPRGACVTHAAVMAQTEILEETVSTGEAGRTSIGWVPFFHDLGLFLSVLPAAIWGLTSHLLPTERFARDPAEWLRLAASTRAALTLAPSSGFGNALRALRRGGERVDLGALEVARFAAEGVEPGVVHRLLDVAGELNLDPRALGSSYGMAESVLAVTLSTPGSGLWLDRISLDALVAEGRAIPATAGPARTMVGCGTPKMGLRVADPDGGELPERAVGEIQLRGASLMSGYVGADPPDPFRDGWLRTGDLGYLADGQLFITGRVKDMVIVMGRNYYPEDFEWAAARVEGVRPGRCVAFNVPGSEEVVVLAEVVDGSSPAALMRELRRAIVDAVGLRPGEIVLLPPGALEKTSSGKLQRRAMRDTYLDGALTTAAR